VRKARVAFLLAFLSGVPALGAEILVAASANASHVIRDLASAFEKESGHRVRVSVAASGTIYTQILNGAPFDAFFSADKEYPQRLVEAGLAEADSLTVYAIGRLALWSPNRNVVDVARLEMKALVHPGVRKVAIANPRHAPYGEYALEAVRHFGLEEEIRPKLVLGENAAQALQFADSGAAQLAIIPLSLALSYSGPANAGYWTIPESAHSKLEQAAVVLKGGKADVGIVKRFLSFTKSEKGRKLLEDYGYALPEKGQVNRP